MYRFAAISPALLFFWEAGSPPAGSGYPGETKKMDFRKRFRSIFDTYPRKGVTVVFVSKTRLWVADDGWASGPLSCGQMSGNPRTLVCHQVSLVSCSKQYLDLVFLPDWSSETMPNLVCFTRPDRQKNNTWISPRGTKTLPVTTDASWKHRTASLYFLSTNV